MDTDDEQRFETLKARVEQLEDSLEETQKDRATLNRVCQDISNLKHAVRSLTEALMMVSDVLHRRHFLEENQPFIPGFPTTPSWPALQALLEKAKEHALK